MGVSPSAAQLQQQLVDELAALRREDPLAPALVVVPSWPAAVQLRRRLAAACETGAHASVRFTTPSGLVHALAAAEAADRELRALPPWGFELLVRRAIEGDGGYFAGVASRPGLTGALAGTMRRLRRLGVTPERLEALAGKAKEPAERERWRSLAAVGRTLQQRLPLAGRGPGFADEATLLAVAADVVEQSAPAVARHLGARWVKLWGVDDAFDGAPTWKRLLDALEQAGQVEVSRAPRPGEPFVAWPRPGPVRIRSVSCATELEEADVAVEQVIAAAQAGVPLWRTAVICRRDGPPLRRVREALRRAGLPVFVPGGEAAADTPAGRAVLGWLALVRDGMRRVPLMDWLRQAPLRPQWLGLEPSAWHPALWERLSVRAGLAGDPGAWAARLQRLQAAPGEESGAEAASALLPAIRALLQELDAFPRWGTWSAMARAACEWLDRAVDGGAPGTAAVRARLAGLARLDQVDMPGASVSIELFAEAADGVLGIPSAVGEGPRFEQGAVALLTAPQAVGCAFDAVVVTGLVQPGFPAGPSPDPVLSPQDLEWLSGVGPVEQAVRHSLREEALFAWAATAARTGTVLTRARFDAASGRELLASPFVERLERAGVIDETVRLAPLFVLSRQTPAGLANLPSVHDVDVAVARWLGTGGIAEMGRFYPHGARGAAARRARWGSALTPYDGWVGDRLDSSGATPQRPMWSPTELEDYARCPRLYLFHRLLGMEAEGEPEEGEGLTGLVRGGVVHRALGRFYQEVLGSAGDTLPPGWEAALRAAVQEALGQDEAALAELAGVARVQADALSQVLARFVVQDAARRSREGLVPVQVEKPFGGLALAVGDGQPVYFKGRIDRLDVRPGAGSGPPGRVRVVDYKSGRPKDGPAARLEGGLRLQPAVYLRAASELTGADVACCSAALVYLDSTGSPHWVELSGAEWSAAEPVLRRVVRALVAGVEAGYFAPDPHPAFRCSACQFYAICGPEATRQLARKSRPPQAAELDRVRQEVR